MAEENKENLGNSNGEQNTITKEEMAEAISKARTEERTKLMGKVESYKATLVENTETIKTLEVRVATLEKDNAKLEKEIKNHETELQNKLEEGKQMSAEELEKLKTERDEAISRAEKAEKEFAGYKAQQELENYRLEKVKDLDEDFRDLVKGSTKEDIDKSYEKIKEKQEKITKKYGGQRANPPLPSPHKGVNKTPGKVSIEDIAKMSMQEYKEWKESNKK